MIGLVAVIQNAHEKEPLQSLECELLPTTNVINSLNNEVNETIETHFHIETNTEEFGN